MAAMTSTLFTCSSPLIKPLKPQLPPFSLPFTHTPINPINSSFKTLKKPSISAVSTPIAETSSQNSSYKPSKTLPFRVGHGFDLHRLEPGYPLIIGGINIPHDRGCEAHSDDLKWAVGLLNSVRINVTPSVPANCCPLVLAQRPRKWERVNY